MRGTEEIIKGCISLVHTCDVMYQSIPKPPIPPGQSPGIWLALSSVQQRIWPKMRPARWGIWLSCQNVCQRSEAKGFRNSLIQQVSSVHGHCSCRFHMGFSFVVVLYSSIVEYAFVLSVERRQAEQEIRSDWKFCRTCFHSFLRMPGGWGIWPSLKL